MTPKAAAYIGVGSICLLVVASIIGASWVLHVWPDQLPRLAGVCVYTAKECSIAFATWVLALMTSLAFVAAAVAALYTGRLFRLENERVVSITPCRDAAHSSTPTVSSITIAQNGDLTTATPGAKELRDYVPVLYEVLNLGRTPLLRLSAKCGFERGNLKSQQLCEVTFGNIGDHGLIHIGIYLHNSHPTNFILEFTDLASNRGAVEIHGTDKNRPGKVIGNVSFAIPLGSVVRRDTVTMTAREVVSELRGIKEALATLRPPNPNQ